MNRSWILFVVVGSLLQGAFTFFGGKGLHRLDVLLKGAASVCFVVVGALGLAVTQAPAYGWLVFLGLLCGAAGDILLELNHEKGLGNNLVSKLGVGAFFLGHIFYIIAMITKGPLFLAWSLPLAVVAALFFIPWLRKQLNLPQEILPYGILYIVILTICAVFAFGQLFTGLPHLGSYLLTIGAAFFALSDYVLIRNAFGTGFPASRLVILSSYYIGQLLIALSIFCIL